MKEKKRNGSSQSIDRGTVHTQCDISLYPDGGRI